MAECCLAQWKEKETGQDGKRYRHLALCSVPTRSRRAFFELEPFRLKHMRYTLSRHTDFFRTLDYLQSISLFFQVTCFVTASSSQCRERSCPCLFRMATTSRPSSNNSTYSSSNSNI